MRIIYWNTSCLQPEIEAVSKEVFQLARHFRPSVVFGVSRHYTFRFSLRKRYVGFHPKFDAALRLLIPLVESGGDLNHVYGESCPWIFHKTLHRKPTLATIASETGPPQLDFLARCRKIFVQTTPFRQQLLALGLAADTVEVVYPAVNLAAFRPDDFPRRLAGPPKVLFASAPRSQEEMHERGVHLLLQAARHSTDIQYHFLYRQWHSGYTSLEATRQAIRTHGLTHVQLTNTVIDHMPAVYNQHHFTVIPALTAAGGKECPNSLVEGLACGLPVLITSVSPFAYFVDEQQCGIVFEPTPIGLVGAVEQGWRRYAELSANAVHAAHTYFSEDAFLGRMTQAYHDVLTHSGWRKS